MFLKCRRRKSRVIMLMMTTQLFQEKATDINIFCDTEFKASINHHRLMHLHKKRLIRNNIGTKNWMFTGRAGQWLEAFSEPLIFKLGFTSLYCLHTWTLTGQILHYQTGNIEYTRHIVFFFLSYSAPCSQDRYLRIALQRRSLYFSVIFMNFQKPLIYLIEPQKYQNYHSLCQLAAAIRGILKQIIYKWSHF